jgi:lantibiotic modifying enzyme
MRTLIKDNIAQRTTSAYNKIETLLKNQELNEGFINNGNLFNGYAGIVLFRFSTFSVYPEKANEAYLSLERLIDSYNDSKNLMNGHMTLCSGLSGFYFLLQKLHDFSYLDKSVLEDIIPINELIFEDTLKAIRQENTDFLHGAGGQILYLLQSKHDPKREDYIKVLTDELSQIFIEDDKGGHFPNYFAKVNLNSDSTNLSLSHGNVGLLLVLIKVYKEAINRKTLEPILRAGIAYILHYYEVRIPGIVQSAFPLQVNDALTKSEMIEEQYYAENMSWCYGDLAIIWLLYQSAELLSTPEWHTIADQVGSAISNNLNDQYLNHLNLNSHLCHGASGIAIFFKTLYNFSGNRLYLDGYNKLIEVTLINLENDIGRPAFMNQRNPFGLLEGLCGPLMVLTDYSYGDVLQGWDEMFLLS